MRRRVLLTVGVAGLLVAATLAAVLTVRRIPRLVGLTPVAGVVRLTGGVPAIDVRSREGARTLDYGWCGKVARPVAAGQAVVAWTDGDRLGRTRVWRIEEATQPICRFTESTAAATRANQTLRTGALLAGAAGLLGFAGYLLETWRALPRG